MHVFIQSLFQADFVQRMSLTVNIDSVMSSTNIIQHVAKGYESKIIDRNCSLVPEKNPNARVHR